MRRHEVTVQERVPQGWPRTPGHAPVPPGLWQTLSREATSHAARDLPKDFQTCSYSSGRQARSALFRFF